MNEKTNNPKPAASILNLKKKFALLVFVFSLGGCLPKYKAKKMIVDAGNEETKTSVMQNSLDIYNETKNPPLEDAGGDEAPTGEGTEDNTNTSSSSESSPPSIPNSQPPNLDPTKTNLILPPVTFRNFSSQNALINRHLFLLSLAFINTYNTIYEEKKIIEHRQTSLEFLMNSKLTKEVSNVLIKKFYELKKDQHYELSFWLKLVSDVGQTEELILLTHSLLLGKTGHLTEMNLSLQLKDRMAYNNALAAIRFLEKRSLSFPKQVKKAFLEVASKGMGISRQHAIKEYLHLQSSRRRSVDDLYQVVKPDERYLIYRY